MDSRMVQIPEWCRGVFEKDGQVAVLEHDGAREGGGGAVLGYATHENAFEKRSNIQFLLSTQLAGKPDDAQFAHLDGGRFRWHVKEGVKFVADLSELEKEGTYEELRGEVLALGFIDRKQDLLVKVFLAGKSEGGIFLEMDADARQQILGNFKTRNNKLTMYLCRDCASLRNFVNRQRMRRTSHQKLAGASPGSHGAGGAGGSSGGVHEQALLHVLPLKYEGPYALVRKDVMSKLKKANPSPEP